MSEVHISPNWLYLAIFGALMVLTLGTVFVAGYDLGPLNDVVALGIAVTKASLVILFFMHVRYAGKLVKVVVVGSIFWLMILFGLIGIDYVSRGSVVADPAAVESSIAIDDGWTKAD
jgi:cytochrome c oxidase subunit 4